jgi:hypothetical protein
LPLIQRMRRRLLDQDFDGRLFGDMMDLFRERIEIATRESSMRAIAKRIASAPVDMTSHPDELSEGAIPNFGVAKLRCHVHHLRD